LSNQCIEEAVRHAGRFFRKYFGENEMTMGTNIEKIRAANERYAAAFGDKGRLPHHPVRRFAVVTCMDCRLDPAKFAGIAEGDAHVIRNAGGRVSDDVIRSLLISCKMLGTNEWFVIQHTHCGMQGFTNEEARARFAEDAAAQGRDAAEAYSIDFMPISGTIEESVVRDVQRLRTHPLVPASVAIHGYVYDVHTGRLAPVEEAEQIGAAK